LAQELTEKAQIEELPLRTYRFELQQLWQWRLTLTHVPGDETGSSVKERLVRAAPGGDDRWFHKIIIPSASRQSEYAT
jgi:hypothetical protein